MNFSEIETWLRSKIIHKGYLSLESYPKGKKIYEIQIGRREEQQIAIYLNAFHKVLTQSIKTIQKKKVAPIRWFKLNIIDNAVTRLVGMGEISTSHGLDVIGALLVKDTAAQSGDTIIGLFDLDKEWILKATYSQDENRIYLKFYGEESLREKLEGASGQII